jgi:competence protein ComEA
MPPAGAASSTPSPGAPAPPAATSLVVDVTGKVRRPGIVELPAGSRVVDALEAAGGARPRADVSALNLARLLVDGEQIVVGVDVPAGASPAAPGGTGDLGTETPTVNLNTGTAEQLEALPGVGPVTAAAIIEWRTQHGAFTSIDELLEVAGIGEATLAEIEPFAQL